MRLALDGVQILARQPRDPEPRSELTVLAASPEAACAARTWIEQLAIQLPARRRAAARIGAVLAQVELRWAALRASYPVEGEQAIDRDHRGSTLMVGYVEDAAGARQPVHGALLARDGGALIAQWSAERGLLTSAAGDEVHVDPPERHGPVRGRLSRGADTCTCSDWIDAETIAQLGCDALGSLVDVGSCLDGLDCDPGCL